MATDIRSTSSATFKADTARKTKVDKGTPVAIARCDEIVCAAWANDIDEKLEQINEVFVDGAAIQSLTLAGDLDVGGNDVINVGLVDGVDVSAHAARHLPGGADALATATPVDVATANAEGSATSFARSDHVHAIANNAVADAKLRDSAATSVIGRSANSAGDPADIAASGDGQFLARRSGALSFAALSSSDLPATGDMNARVQIQKSGSAVGTRRAINFIEGRGTSITTSDDAGNERVQVTVANTNVPVGMITAYGGSAAPSGWLLCDGSAVSRTTYADLFAVVGTTFGAGNGSTTFNVPNLVDRSPMGAGATVARGATAGSTTSAHTHGAGSYAAGTHTHGTGTLAVDSHSHSAGTLAAASHSHGAGTLAADSHTHTSGTYSAASHAHILGDSGYAFINIKDADGDVGCRTVTSSNWGDERQCYGAAGTQIDASWTGGVPLGGQTNSNFADITGSSGSAAPAVSGSTASAGASVTGSTASTAPAISGSTGSTAPAVSGTSGSTAPSVLHPVLGLNYIIYHGA